MVMRIRSACGYPRPCWKDNTNTLIEEAIITHCKELIAGYKCPRSVEIRQEPLPISGAGKILKSELRRPFWEGHERQVN